MSQIITLAGAVPPRYRALVHLGASCSLRWGELAALRRDDLGLEAQGSRRWGPAGEDVPDWWPYAAEFPQWHVWRGVSGLVYGRGLVPGRRLWSAGRTPRTYEIRSGA